MSDTKEGEWTRLSVNLADDVADALRDLCARQGITATEGVRQAIAVWKMIRDEHEDGNRVMIVTVKGRKATWQEMIIRD